MLRGKKKKRKERELGMFWTEDGRGKKEKGKEKSVVTWVDEKKRGEKKKEVESRVWREKKGRKKKLYHNIFTIFLQ